MTRAPGWLCAGAGNLLDRGPADPPGMGAGTLAACHFPLSEQEAIEVLPTAGTTG